MYVKSSALSAFTIHTTSKFINLREYEQHDFNIACIPLKVHSVLLKFICPVSLGLAVLSYSIRLLRLINTPYRCGATRNISHLACNLLNQRSRFNIFLCVLHTYTSYLGASQQLSTLPQRLMYIISKLHIYLKLLSIQFRLCHKLYSAMLP